MTVYGVDVSRHQGAINWAAVKADGISFAIRKATQGTSYDYQSWYGTDVSRATAAELGAQGSYLFMMDESGGAQADYYVARVRAYGAAGHGHVLDTETAPGPEYPTAAETDAAAKRIKALLPGVKVGCYSGFWYWSGILGNPPMPASVDYYWDSRYVSNSTQRPWRTIVDEVPSAWFTSTRTGGRAPAIIQVNSNALVKGIGGPVDLDVFPGSLDQLRALLLGQKVEEDVTAQEVWTYPIEGDDGVKRPAWMYMTTTSTRSFQAAQAAMSLVPRVTALGDDQAVITAAVNGVLTRVKAVETALVGAGVDRAAIRDALLAAVGVVTSHVDAVQPGTVVISDEALEQLKAAFPQLDPQAIADAVHRDVAAAFGATPKAAT